MNVAKIGFKWIPLSNQTVNSLKIKGYYEYLINNVPLSELIDTRLGYTNFITNNFISSIWKAGEQFDTINRTLFLGQDSLKSNSPDLEGYKTYFLNNEIPIYTCPCGEISCKGIIIKKNITSNSDIIEWNFGENGKIESIYFDKNQYEEAINQVFDILSTPSV